MEERKTKGRDTKRPPEDSGLVGQVASQLEESYQKLEQKFQEISQTIDTPTPSQIEQNLTVKLKRVEEENARLRPLASVGETVGMVIHALRNQLGGIIGFADLLQRDLAKDDRFTLTNRNERQKYIQKINEGLQDLLKTVNNLLDYTRPDKLNLQEIELNQLLEKVIGLFEMELEHGQKQIKVERAKPKEEISAKVDSEKFQHVVLNLLQNAAQAVGDKGSVQVTLDIKTDVGDNKVYMKVSDNGPGMSEEALKRVFTPFFTSKTGGTGLGLAAVKKIVEAHRGEVKVKSEVGKGTEVEIWIPRE